MANFENPFRPGAGHPPPHLAGRQKERAEFLRLIGQKTILENIVITGLRGVGKTVLMDSLKPEGIRGGWLWVGTDLSETTSISEDNMAIRLCTDLALITSQIMIYSSSIPAIGFTQDKKEVQTYLDFNTLHGIYQSTPGLSLDKLKTVIMFAWNAIHQATQGSIRGIVFAYDEAQNLSDRSERDQFPLSLILDSFQSLQKQGYPVMLLLTGLPTLFPKLVEARTFSERMFRVLFLDSLTQAESREAILKPIEQENCPLKLSEQSVKTIISMSDGYPYFIQFICREVYEAFIQRIDSGQNVAVPVNEIEQKLDTDFFAGRWAKATDRQKALMIVIANLGNTHEFTVQEVASMSATLLEKPFSNSHVNQMLTTLNERGLIFRNRHGKYSFAVPLFDKYILRQAGKESS
ncbi:MAG: hypothetical protein KDI44_14440 [Thiothrix sp.]|nr:hypothetical protein [Thiothrix sp.]